MSRKPQSYTLDESTVRAIDAAAKKSGALKSRIVEELIQKGLLSDDSPRPMVISVMSFKGGVGKTSVTVNLALCLANRGRRVLVIDTDGQGNASQSLNCYDPHATEPCIADVLLSDAKGRRAPISKIMRKTEHEGVWCVPSSFRFNDPDTRMRSEVASGIDSRLQHAIEDLSEEGRTDPEKRFDYVIVDCPPSLGLVVTNAITALDAGNPNSMVIIPVRVDYYAISGLKNTVQVIQSVAEERRRLPYSWALLRTIVERNTVSYREGVEMIKREIDNPPFLATSISKNVDIVESTFMHQPVVVYNPSCKSSIEFESLTDEIETLNADAFMAGEEAGIDG